MPDEKRTDLATTPQPIAVQTDAHGNPTFTHYGEMRRWCQQRIVGGGLPAHIKTAENLESIFFMLSGLGVNVMANIGNTMMVNNVAGIWGNLPEALCRASGEWQDMELWWVDDKDQRLDPEKPHESLKASGAVCKVTRKGQKPVTRFYTLHQAGAAGLTNKPGPWKQHTVTMLGHRARALALRAAFPDALQGVAIREADEYVDVTDGDGNIVQSAPGQTLVKRRAKQQQDQSRFESLGGESA